MKVHTSLNYIHFTFSTADKKNDPYLLNKIKLFFLKKKREKNLEYFRKLSRSELATIILLEALRHDMH